MIGKKPTTEGIPEGITEEEWFKKGEEPKEMAKLVHWQEAESLALEGFDMPPGFQKLTSREKYDFAAEKLEEVRNQIESLATSDIPAIEISDKLTELNERRMILELFCDDARQRIIKLEGAFAIAEPEETVSVEGVERKAGEEGEDAGTEEKKEELPDLVAAVEAAPEVRSLLREYIAKTNETITGWQNMRDTGFVKGGPEWQHWMDLRKELNGLFQKFPPDLQKALIKVDIGRKKGREKVSKMLDEMEEKEVIERIRKVA